MKGCPRPQCGQPSAKYGVRWRDGILCAEHSDEAARMADWGRDEQEAEAHGRTR